MFLGCGGKLSGTSGVLSYPPDDYETYTNRISCSWTIETNSAKILNITFSKFYIGESTDCRSGWLQVFILLMLYGLELHDRKIIMFTLFLLL